MRSLHDFELEHVNGLGISLDIPGIENDDEEGAFIDEVVNSARMGLYLGLFVGTCTATVIVLNRIARLEF